MFDGGGGMYSEGDYWLSVEEIQGQEGVAVKDDFEETEKLINILFILSTIIGILCIAIAIHGQHFPR